MLAASKEFYKGQQSKLLHFKLLIIESVNAFAITVLFGHKVYEACTVQNSESLDSHCPPLECGSSDKLDGQEGIWHAGLHRSGR